jgi:uncharacterized protein
VVLYNGWGGVTFQTLALDNAVKIVTGNVNFAVLAFSQLENDMEGIALVTSSNVVVQFISYEGTFAATNGPASGLTSVNIGVIESNGPVGHSLQLTGTGCGYTTFTWATTAAKTKGFFNNNQIICGQVRWT